MRKKTLISLFFIITIFSFLSEKAFSQDSTVQKINLTWPSYFDHSSFKNKPKANIKLDPLRKVTYKCDGLTINFKEDHFSKKFKDYELHVEFADGAYGDINDDGKEDAVVFLQSHTGGSGVIVTMAIVMNQNGKYRNTDCIDIGDNEDVNTIQFKPNKVTLDMLLHLSDEPHCCPNSPLTFTLNISKEGRILNKTTFKNIQDAAFELSSGNMMGMEEPDNKSISHFNKAIRLYPQYTLAYLYRAEALEELGKFSQAKRDYDSVLRLSSQHAKAYRGRAHCYIKLKNYNHAISDATQAIRIEPENGGGYLLRGGANAHLGKYREAISDYSLSIEKHTKGEKNPCDPVQNRIEGAYLTMAHMYVQLKDYPNAIAVLSKIIEMKTPEEDKEHICIPEGVKYKSLKKEASALREEIYKKLAKDKNASRSVTK